MKNLAIQKLTLYNFKIHINFACDLTGNNIILIGNNGTGKTSILEAISLLSPGKGMLSTNPEHLNYNKSQKSEIIATFNDSTVVSIENTTIKNATKKIKINDKPINKQADLANWCDIISFTGDTQYSFLLSSTNRRKFIDRIVFGFFNNHASLLIDYDKLIKERIKVLLLPENNNKWLDILEKQISSIGANIAHNRASILSSFNKKSIESALLNVNLTTDGIFENLVLNGNSIERITENFIFSLAKNRQKDKEAARTFIGTHRTDFNILYNNESLEMVSSGRQKIFLLSIFEIFSTLLTEKKQRTPIILFDEISSFVDHDNFDKILDSFTKHNSQIWMTSPRKYDLFDKYHAQIILL